MAALTISENDGLATYTIGSTPSAGPFSVDFPYFSASEIVVTKIVSGVATALVNGSDYTLAGTAADDGYSSGAITLTPALSSCVIRIERELSTVKSTNFSVTGPLQISSMNTMFSRLFAWQQDLVRRSDLSLSIPAEEKGLNLNLEAPVVADRKGKMLAWDPADGSLTESTVSLADIEAEVIAGGAWPGGNDNDVLSVTSGRISTFSPESTITWYEGINSLYARMPTVYAQRSVNSTKAPSGSVVMEAFQYLTTPYAAASFPGYGTLNYALVDDTYRAFDYCNAFALISRNALRQPVDGTSSTLDLGPEFFFQRKVPNTGNLSYVGFLNFQASTSMVTKTFTTDAIASSNGTSTITVTMPNQFSIGDFVWFPEAITVGGLTFGGPSDQYNGNSNAYGSYYVQSATSSAFTITVDGTASSTASTGTGKYIRFHAVGTLGANPFSFTNGSGTVTVTHTGHNLSTGHIVFFSGATAAAGVTINGNHAITKVNDNSYTIALSAIQDGAAAASATTTGGGASVTYEATSSNGEGTHVVAGMGAQVIDGNSNNPYGEWSLGCGSPPNKDGGLTRQWFWRKGGFYYVDETPPTDGGIAVRSLALKAPASSDLNTVLDTTTAGQNNAIKLKRGGTEKIQIVADSSNLFRIRDVPNTANLLSYNGTTAQLTLGAQGDIVIAGTGQIDLTTKMNTLASASAKAGFNLPHGAAPSSPIDGDIWTTTAGLYVRINGVTVGPLS